jgi:DNA repair exonuclease SbcCD nuclease subunit
MEPKKVAFIAFSDIQIEAWKKFSINDSRLLQNGQVLEKIHFLCKKHKCPALFGGDFYDNPKQLSNKVLSRSFEWLDRFRKDKINIYSIHGNHDQSDKNTINSTSDNYLYMLSIAFPNVQLLSGIPTLHGEFVITGVNFLSDNVGFKNQVRKIQRSLDKDYPHLKKVLLIHSDLPGAIDTSGREIGSSNLDFKLTKLFKGFDLVLCGHIHKPQRIRKNILIMGATHQQRISDSGTNMGCWLIYEDLTYQFVDLMMPQFKYIKAGQEKPDDDHFYIEEQKKLTIQTSKALSSFNTKNPTKLVKAYLKVKKIKSASKRQILINYLSL